MTTTTRNYPATERTINYIKDLLDERDLTASKKHNEAIAGMTEPQIEHYMCVLRQKARSMTQEQASGWIERLKALPKKHKATQARGGATQTIKSDVPAGRYAVTGDDGTTDFYRVDRPTEGRWDGYIFVKLLLGGPHGHPREERVPIRNIQTILDKVAKAGPKAASIRYGKELGSCGVCGRTLTNPESIEAGIGPVCRGKMGW